MYLFLFNLTEFYVKYYYFSSYYGLILTVTKINYQQPLVLTYFAVSKTLMMLCSPATYDLLIIHILDLRFCYYLSL